MDLPSDVKQKKKIQSSIPELSVGDERKCFNQIRKASTYIKPESLLWNGWPAGKFALDYVIGHHMKRKRKAEEKLEINPNAWKRVGAHATGNTGIAGEVTYVYSKQDK